MNEVLVTLSTSDGQVLDQFAIPMVNSNETPVALSHAIRATLEKQYEVLDKA